MKLLANQILFRPHPSNEYTESGFYVPENAREINNKGTIVKTGTGTKNKPMRLKEGMIVYRTKDWGTPLSIDGQLHFLMDEQAIIAIE